MDEQASEQAQVASPLLESHRAGGPVPYEPALAGSLEAEAHVWLAHPEQSADPEVVERLLTLISDEEKERYHRFYFERDRHLFLVAHALVRTTLSRYADVAPQDWRFVKNRYGRPEIDDPLGASLRFNLSHTHGLAAMLVTGPLDGGVDVETLDRRVDHELVSRRMFAPLEQLELMGRPVEQRHHRFFEYWTLKEAYIKARGMGLALPLEQFSFHQLDRGGVRVAFDARLEDDAGGWQFLSRPWGEVHMLAVALRRGYRADLRIHRRLVQFI